MLHLQRMNIQLIKFFKENSMKKETVIPSIAMAVLIIALISLIFLPPVIAKNKFVKHIENGEYILACGVLETNSENVRIKNDAENIIKLLDADIENILVDMYNEEADLVEAEGLANLYKDFSALNSLSSESGEVLLTTVEMFKELDAMKACIEEGDSYDALGKGLLSTKYANIEDYTNVLSRSVDESVKNKIVEGLENGIDEHISRAKGNYGFASVPNLLSGETVLSKFLLDASQYNNLICKINEYNRAYACAVSGCKEWAKDKYCEGHKCEEDDCNNLKKGNFDYCSKHICAASGCENSNYGDVYCYNHECEEDGCKKYASNGDYCDVHAKKSNSSSYSSSYGGSFTNKYGSSTTKCVVSGCSNNIASSGDTNCCTRHSNRCGNCNCYIDGDAMFCMSCLVGALG